MYITLPRFYQCIHGGKPRHNIKGGSRPRQKSQARDCGFSFNVDLGERSEDEPKLRISSHDFKHFLYYYLQDLNSIIYDTNFLEYLFDRVLYGAFKSIIFFFFLSNLWINIQFLKTHVYVHIVGILCVRHGVTYVHILTSNF